MKIFFFNMWKCRAKRNRKPKEIEKTKLAREIAMEEKERLKILLEKLEDLEKQDFLEKQQEKG